MELEELKGRIAEKGSLRICEICGLPYRPYHTRQCTCGDKACKAEHHRRYVREYNKMRRKEQPEVVREYSRQCMRKFRARQREEAEAIARFDEMVEHIEQQAAFDHKITEYGHRYGDVQKEKTLASVPKIDVTIGGNNDDIHTDDQ